MKNRIVLTLVVILMVCTMILPANAASTYAEAAQKIPDGKMVYYQDFNFADNSDTTAVMNQLGWKIVNKADGAVTDNTAKYSFKDKQLFIDNLDASVGTSSDSYASILGSGAMWEVCQGDYTLQYDLIYTAAEATTRYIVMLESFGIDTNISTPGSYFHSFHIRVSGSANNQAYIGGTWFTWDAKKSVANTDFYAAGVDDDTTGSSVVKKVFGETYDANSYPLLNKKMTVRLNISKTNGITAYINDIKVSEFNALSDGAANWGTLENLGCFGIGIKPSPKVSGYVDNIAIWTGLGTMPADKTVTYHSAGLPVLTTTAATTKAVTTKDPSATTAATTTKAGATTTKAGATTTASTTAPKDNNNMGLYIGIAAAVVVVGGVAAFIIIKKRGSSGK